MRLARCGALALVAVVLAGCGGGKSDAEKRRDAVNAYFDRLNGAQAGLVSALGEIDHALRSFRLGGNTRAQLRELRFARERVATARQKVRALAPPPEASKIHTDVLQLLALQQAAADELLQIVLYQPRLAQVLAPLPGAGKQLAADIREAAKSSGPAPVSSSEKTGAGVWVAARCGSCHTLAPVGSTGTKGPNLDVLRLTAAEIAAKVRSGGGGMPAYAKKIPPAQIDALASFVSAAEAREAANAASLAAFGAAFAHYRTSLDAIVTALGRLAPPPVLRPSYLAEEHTLGRAADLSGAVAEALARNDVAAANKAIRQLFAAAAAAGQASTQRAVAGAVRAYNDRLRRIATLSAGIARERQRLVAQVG